MCNGYVMMMLGEKKGKRREKMEKKNKEEAREKKTKNKRKIKFVVVNKKCRATI